MSYKPYVTAEYYRNVYKGVLLGDDADKALLQASRHVDTLTYNRIVGRGFDNLTEFQRDIIMEVVCRQAEFEYENSDMITTYMQQYSINGVNMSFGKSWNLEIRSGIAISKENYSLLEQTGLCCRSLGRW